tara:strand:- start:83216 stop:83674 length:459 start_codon:yes stop_codon:yes gene_type:complete
MTRRFATIHQRRGAVVIEGAVVLSVILILLLGMLDLAMGVLRFNLVSEAARRGTREAIVRGELSEPERASWGPSTFNGSAADSSEIATTIRSALVALEPANVSITAEWPDGGNAMNDRVRILVSYQHQPIVPFLFGTEPIVLRGASTMRIQH